MGLRTNKATTESERLVVVGTRLDNYVNNRTTTSKYTWFTFFPIAIAEQFRRFGNVYFLVVGCIMALGEYTYLFDSAISPWTTLGPLAVVVAISLAQEGFADLSRHRSDERTNKSPCIILRRSEDIGESGGKREDCVMNGQDVEVRLSKSYADPTTGKPRVKTRAPFPESPAGTEPTSQQIPLTPAAHPNNTANVAFEQVKRMNIRVGNLVLVRNREMIPADLILLASSTEGGNAYVETSSIDGETNLKLRTSPQLPVDAVKSQLHSRLQVVDEDDEEQQFDALPLYETLEQATKRITRFSSLGFPAGVSSLYNPDNLPEDRRAVPGKKGSTFAERMSFLRGSSQPASSTDLAQLVMGSEKTYLATVTSEPPNASVNTYSGKLTLPPLENGTPSISVALGAENILLRGAVLRNTEWAIGVAVFTGVDTKLVQNAFDTPSKFSKLDKIMNQTVVLVICAMLACVLVLSGLAVTTAEEEFDHLWYAGYSSNSTKKWPYLGDMDAPDWDTSSQTYIQNVFLFITLLNNFVPLSLYVTVEIIVFFLMFLISLDLAMYHKDTDTPAQARSTIVTDLGQVEYVFSDKTGTLTQNVMRFKRCSVDGMVFGAPVEKSAPGDREKKNADVIIETEVSPKAFHPLKQLLVGPVSTSSPNESIDRSAGLEGYGELAVAPESANMDFGPNLTFNAEMFLRVMSLCHTVVVEKEIDASSIDNDDKPTKSNGRKNAKQKNGSNDENGNEIAPSTPAKGNSSAVSASSASARKREKDISTGRKGPDGAIEGYAYQAESPDEGALVSAASLTYGFQLLGRTSTGIQLAISSPSLLSDERIASGLKSGELTPKELASETASPKATKDGTGFIAHDHSGEAGDSKVVEDGPRLEIWEVLAVNKFDSDRKRMSVLVRSPEKLGSITMLLCKGADSSMLDSRVCEGGTTLMSDEAVGTEKENSELSTSLDVVVEDAPSAVNVHLEDKKDADNWEMATMLGIQAHLGDFATEGLRTLVLGVRILSEDECGSWMTKYRAAATSIENRDEKLRTAALEIETKLHIVGATAIEDQLQDGVPETIAMLEKAGIKLWVCTGDKRETAIEIGYSTKVLTPKMHLTEVADAGGGKVKAQMAMEFFRLVKAGRLKEYQITSLEEPEKTSLKSLFRSNGALAKTWRSASWSIGRFIGGAKKVVCFWRKEPDNDDDDKIAVGGGGPFLDPVVRRKEVRDLAGKLIQDYQSSPEGQQERDRRISRSKSLPKENSRTSVEEEYSSLASDDLPTVFGRAQSARDMITAQQSVGSLDSSMLRSLAIAADTSRRLSASMTYVVDEDILSLQSFAGGDGADVPKSFDRRKRTILERLFAVDRDVRKGHLSKHLSAEKKKEIESREVNLNNSFVESSRTRDSGAGPRALVIEGAALAHLLGHPRLEELLFAVASSCDSVIACRVSPKQKALLVKLVRNYVVPTPITLAIGDGANDVGMIQEAHVGVGISGLEGQQAVNASDFAIGQFRFLQELLLIHGRWNFIRMAKVVLFSFYKNAILAGLLIIFSGRNLYSGTPLVDSWVVSMFNFAAGCPILFLGFFDRDLDRDYVKRNPEVYACGPRNENLTLRNTFRWVGLTFVHIFSIYFLSAPSLSLGGAQTPAFKGLARDLDEPGDGEGGGIKIFGTTIFTNLVWMLAYKVLYEGRALIHGVWPALTCRKGVGEGFFNRVAYTWVGVSWLSFIFLIVFYYIYQVIGRSGASTYSTFTDVASHLLNMRSITWMSSFFVPIAAMVFDVAGKTFSNMYFPTQTQIHMEIQHKERVEAKKLQKGLDTSLHHHEFSENESGVEA